MAIIRAFLSGSSCFIASSIAFGSEIGPFIALLGISGSQHGTIVGNELTRAANLSHVIFTGTSFGPFELHSCPCGMSRSKKSQQHWAWVQSQHVVADFCWGDFAEYSAERKNVAAWLIFLPSQFLGR